jgi:hypothetical protein
MSNVLHSRKNDRWVRHHTGSIISNDDAETHLTVFNQQKKVFRMSIAKSTFRDTDTSIIGYFQNTWQVGSTIIPSGANTSVAFSGFADPTAALANINGSNTYPNLQGSKYISLGGGMGGDGTFTAGKFTMQVLQNIVTAINNGSLSQYTGILFDVEYVDSTGIPAPDPSTPSISLMYPFFKSAFAAAQAKNLKVIVCVGHSGNIEDLKNYAPDTILMQNFLGDANVNYVSPQLYGPAGTDNPPAYNATGLPWSTWANSGKPIIVTIPWAQQYECVEAWASAQIPELKLSGFLQWINTPYTGGPNCTGPGPGPTGGPSVTINITNSTSYQLTFNGSSTPIKPNDPPYTSTISIPFPNAIVNFNTSPIANVGNLACSSSQMAVNFGYGNNGPLTNIVASGDFNGVPFKNLGQTALPSNNVGAPSTTTNINILNITYSDNP